MTRALKYTSCLMATCLILTGCQDNQDHRTDLQRSAGNWQKTGYGQALHITMNRVLSYQYNSYGCIQVSAQSHQEANTALSSIEMFNPKRLLIQYQGMVYPSQYTHSDALPSQCVTPITISDTASPSVVFDYFWHTFNDYYAFFSVKNLDWQAQYQQYRAQVTDTMTDEALFALLSDMVAPLQDMHVTLSSAQQEYFSHKPAPLLNAIQQDAALLHVQGKPKDLNSIFEDYQIKSQHVSEQYLLTESVKTLPIHSNNATAVWGKTSSNVGVLVLNNLDAYALLDDATEIQHLKAARTMMDEVMADLHDTEAMIIDIRHNTGGDDAIALAIANHFADRDVLAFNKQAIGSVGRGIPVRQQLKANPSAYTQPVYLLTSQLTISAAEVFTMSMAQLPHVTLVGEQTAGSLSDALHFTLPNGWQMSLSNEVYRNAQGDMFEHIGFTPEHHVPAFSKYDLEMQRFETYDFVLTKLNKAPSPRMNIDDFERQISALQTQGNIPSIAVNVIAQGKSIYNQGFSNQADREVNADSLFNISGLNDMLIGDAIHSANMEGALIINEPFAYLLPFEIANHNKQLTLAQLLTNKSGIVDNPKMLACATSTHAKQCTILHETPDLLLEAYLNADGLLYHKGNFSSHYGAIAQNIPIYSQLGVTLASYVFTQATQAPLSELTQQYIFDPHKMKNTSWQTEYTGHKPTHQLISTANDIGRMINMTTTATAGDDLSYPKYFWHQDNHNAYHRSHSNNATSLLFSDTFNQTGYILLTDHNPQTKEAKARYRKIEQLVFRLTQQLPIRSQ
ncbi:S41 family peptidase [Pseudoalteromonas luteoviolacea]|uniref:Tail specific protease domain-containing protein n=1 Tax=Pseudoalteromonas luteoviolacea S4054 TaxID=1129367 RepID=A0A0F6A8F9_9GAMM|nr:S41 family peptidase [Pseudoalteromonas luteoviolacea]AOT06518.1 hypothetical protein S4054249_00830 [Pseudoalteromonas luteoviolacea]AOT11435.1 hypothetical protein S40542_00830 [Pseudoalteromonas luteoviolacea]AOT16348.1 hypothetical protein S4054_00830 [Pseudoalteromonas luteoviolacea]KKE81689.1 hypothetical protein N479_21490 [Pseudoalteromonas luteoviolacea S4054]KZN71188.1 hypothetical protein N481_19445 [Pseudoalteromonas luteoviolacea S4047-1]